MVCNSSLNEACTGVWCLGVKSPSCRQIILRDIANVLELAENSKNNPIPNFPISSSLETVTVWLNNNIRKDSYLIAVWLLTMVALKSLKSAACHLLVCCKHSTATPIDFFTEPDKMIFRQGSFFLWRPFFLYKENLMNQSHFLFHW